MQSLFAAPLTYCGPAPSPEAWLLRWNFDPWLIATLCAALVFALARPAVRDRIRLGSAVAAGVVMFVSPLCALSSALFTARTVHHLLLVSLIAPLVAWSVPLARRNTLAAATLAHVATFAAWHVPIAYDAAMSSPFIYWVMQLSLLATAIWFWREVRRTSEPAAVCALLVAMIGMGLVGGLLTFAPTALYAAHQIGPTLWDTTALADQQRAGLIMWAPGSAIYLGAALLLAARMLGPAAKPTTA